MQIKVMTTRVQIPRPLKKGPIAANAFIGPKPVYCPIYNSRKKRGRPIKINIIKNGIRKAPATRKRLSILNNDLVIFLNFF